MSKLHLHPRVVFYREGINWVAHCLEFDLAGDGRTREEALECLSALLAVELEVSALRNSSADLFKPAAHEYFAMYDAGEEIAPGHLHIASHHVVIENTHAREYRDAL